ncbi:TetR family transcriptional regulator [Motilibacter rhizosphaerae]|uniref:TetR family transcriptional regulator n=1 Tax=Motilibacter rhizosphaerae TaxID=598652 RepID=A0A4V2F4S3_9ACTN|nr:TetR family transcriptional regulator [Motilibacter rhizosphaerae]
MAEIKQTALRLMREQGTTNIRFADIARAMSMTAPALYRYFSGRDELLTGMIEDAWTDLADELEKSLADVHEPDPVAEFRAVCAAYRRWALADTARLNLAFGLPVPGYAAPAEGPHMDGAARAFSAIAGTVLHAEALGHPVTPLTPPMSPELCAELTRGKGVEHPPAALSPELTQALLHTWASLHGFVTLEANGHFHWASGQHTVQMFDGLVSGLAGYIGLIEPVRPAP